MLRREPTLSRRRGTAKGKRARRAGQPDPEAERCLPIAPFRGTLPGIFPGVCGESRGVKEDDLDSLKVAEDDIEQHIVKYGLDVFPPLDVREETTRAHELFRELRDKWSAFYQELAFRPESNKLSVRSSYLLKGNRIDFATLEFTPRGPVWAFPIKLPSPLGEVPLASAPEEVFWSSLSIIKATFPSIDVLRLGVVRELVFSTGDTSSVPFLACRYGTFPGADPRGGETLVSFRDDHCNIRVKVATIEIRQEARLAATQQLMTQQLQYGLQVQFDVNNIDMRAQSDVDLRVTMERASSLWPTDLLEFLNWRGFGR